MKLRRVRRGQWDVLAMCGARGECPLLDFLAGLEAHLEADGRAMLRALWFAAEHGHAYQKAKKAGTLKVEG